MKNGLEARNAMIFIISTLTTGPDMHFNYHFLLLNQKSMFNVWSMQEIKALLHAIHPSLVLSESLITPKIDTRLARL